MVPRLDIARAVPDQFDGPTSSDGLPVFCDLPAHVPVTVEEIAILRAFLAEEIGEILSTPVPTDAAPAMDIPGSIEIGRLNLPPGNSVACGSAQLYPSGKKSKNGGNVS
jgi:hypothetical protein